MKAVEIVLDDTKEVFGLKETTSSTSGKKMFRGNGFLTYEGERYNVNVYITRLDKQTKKKAKEE